MSGYRIYLKAVLKVLLGCICCSCGSEKKADLITVSPPVEEVRGDGKITGSQVLARVEKAYSELRSYVGTTSIVGQFEYANVTQHDQAEVTIRFSRPNKIRIDGKTSSSGAPFTVVSDGKVVWDSCSLINGGAYKEVATLREAILSYQGVALGATVIIPSALLKIEWSGENIGLPHGKTLLSAFATHARLLGEETLGNYPCYKIVCEREIGTWTMWVDKETFLLRKMERSISEAQMAARKKYGVAGTSGKILRAVDTETYRIDQVNGAIDDAVFAPPR